jgi:hypothetical protein
MRRLLAVVAILALSMAYLSAEAIGLAAAAPDCCSSGLCPMHRMAQGTNCDMDLRHPASQWQSCPVHNNQFTASLVFVRVAPPALAAAEPPRERVPLFASPVAAEMAFDVAAPPPRPSLA